MSAIRFIKTQPDWNSESRLEVITKSAEGPQHFLQLESLDKFGYEFDLFQVLDCYGKRPHLMSTCDPRWPLFVAAELNELGFKNLVGITRRQSRVEGQTASGFFEFGQEGRMFALSFNDYKYRSLVAHDHANNQVLMFRAPMNEFGSIIVSAACGAGGIFMTRYKGDTNGVQLYEREEFLLDVLDERYPRQKRMIGKNVRNADNTINVTFTTGSDKHIILHWTEEGGTIDRSMRTYNVEYTSE